MRSFQTLLFALAVGVVSMVAAEPAFAQATRTWVSGVGDDANPCSRTAPCKTFAGAISKTATSGEINCLDPAGFGALTITKAITVSCETTLGGVLAAGTNGFIVNAPTGAKVTIEGIVFEGAGTGLDGIRVISAAKVNVRNVTIRGFTSDGIEVLSATSGARVVVEDSTIISNGTGVRLTSTAPATHDVFVYNSLIDNNTTQNFLVSGPNFLILSGNEIAGSPIAISNTGGTVSSYGNNVLRGTGLPTETLLLR